MKYSSSTNLITALCIVIVFASFDIAHAGILSKIDPVGHYVATHDPLAKNDPAFQKLFGDEKEDKKKDSSSKDKKDKKNDDSEHEKLLQDKGYCTSVLKNIAILSSAIDLTTNKLKDEQDRLERNKFRLAQLASQATSTATLAAASAPLVVDVNPKIVRPGEVVTIFTTVNSAVSSYSLQLIKGTSVIDSLITNETIVDSKRPYSAQKTFKVDDNATAGTFTVRLFNGTDDVRTDITVISSSAANQTNATTSQVVETVVPTSLTFTNPFAYSKIKQGKSATISWTYQGDQKGLVNLYITAKCVKSLHVCATLTPTNKTNTCPIVKSKCSSGPVTKSLIARNIRVTRGSVTWKVPPKYADKQIIISAEQAGKRVGVSQPIYIAK